MDFFPADYKACEDIVVTGQVLRPAVQDNIAAKFQRTLEIWGEERIVNDDQKTLFVGKFCQGAQVGDFPWWDLSVFPDRWPLF